MRARRCGVEAGRRRAAVACAAMLAVLGITAPLGALTRPARPPEVVRGPFAWLVPAAPAPDWPVLVAPAGAAALAYPPSFRPVGGDTGSVSAAVDGPGGRYVAYLNATPRQGREELHGFAAFRVRLLGEDADVSAQREAAAEGLAFHGGEGSCVIDRYVTRAGHHHYREIACLVLDAHGAGAVVVAAAQTSVWARYRGQLEAAVASFSVT